MSEHTKTPDWDASRFPYYKRFARDYLSSGRLAMMSHLQRSIYSVLLDRSWVEDGLPSEPRRLAAMALCTPDEITEAWTFPLDEAFTEGADGRLRNPRMESERADAVRLRDARSRGGSKSPRSVLQESSKTLPGGAEDCANKPEAEAEAEAEEKKGRADALSLALASLDAPPWLEPLLREYEQHRKDSKKSKLTEKGWRIKVKQAIDAGEASVSAAVSRSISNGYTGLFFQNAQQTASQAPSRASWYKGPPVKPAELSRVEDEIRLRMAQEVGDFMLPDDEAQEMARQKGDHQRLMLDWKLGLREERP